MNKSIKVVWICHFSSPQVRKQLELTPFKSYGDFAPWITNLAQGFSSRKDIELHVVSPHNGLIKAYQSFNMGGVNYHFFRTFESLKVKRDDLGLLRLLQVAINRMFQINKWFIFPINSMRVLSIIRKVHPDIVNLHGAENAYYSSTALWVKQFIKVPIVVTIQGIYSNPQRFNQHVVINKLRARVERTIHRRMRYFGIFPAFFADLIKKDNPKPIFLFQHGLPDLQIKTYPTIEKKYDFTYFGRITDVKGIDKIVEAIALLNERGRKVSLNIIGQCNPAYYNFLQEIIRRYKLYDQVTFTGFLPTIDEVHLTALQARVTVISSRFENLPGTIIESVLMDQPVCATSVGAIPYLNRNGETILLSEYGDVSALAANMLQLLTDQEYASKLTARCKEFIFREFSSSAVVDRWIKQYYAVIEHYHHGTPIPAELLHPCMDTEDKKD